MSNIFITDIVGTGTYAIPTNDTQLASATSGFDTILSGVANLSYDRVLAWVEDAGGPGGAEGTRTLNCLVEKFTYLTKECPSETEVDTLSAAIESALEADANITSVDQQQYHLFQAGAYFLWNRDASGGFLYPNTETDDVAVGPFASPNGKWFDDGDLVLGAAAMSGTERLRVVGDTRLEGIVTVTSYIRDPTGIQMAEQAADPASTAAGEGTFWVKNDAPTVPYFTDDEGDSFQIAYVDDTAPGAVLFWGNEKIENNTTVRYMSPGGDMNLTAQTVEVRFTIPFACTLKNLYVYHNITGSGAQTITYTIMKNGVATSLAASGAPGSASLSDTSNTATFVAGDEVSIRITKSANTTAPQDVMASVEVAQ